MRAKPRVRFIGPRASMFHCGLSGSSMPTNVGSPPMVRRTSCASRSASTRCATCSTCSQSSSVKGLDGRGASFKRRMDME